MLKIFESATLKLTGWYLLILMATTMLFSGVIYQMSTAELSGRLHSLEVRLEGDPSWPYGPSVLQNARAHQEAEANASIFFGLLYTNLAIWVLGGFGSYWLARRTLQPIQEMHEEQSRFASDASHELKTPLAVMKSELELALRDTSLKKDDYKEVISSSLEEVDKLTSLTHSLLKMSRLEHEDIALDGKVDLSAETARVISLLDSDKRVVFKHSSNAWFAKGNESMLRDVCMVLIDNALRYSPSDSPVKVTIKQTTRFIKLSITNEGEGISEKDAEHIFDRFYRADTSRTSQKSSKGYGLGLSVAKRIVDLHQGEITLVSTPKHETTFTVSLPKFV